MNQQERTNSGKATFTLLLADAANRKQDVGKRKFQHLLIGAGNYLPEQHRCSWCSSFSCQPCVSQFLYFRSICGRRRIWRTENQVGISWEDLGRTNQSKMSMMQNTRTVSYSICSMINRCSEDMSMWPSPRVLPRSHFKQRKRIPSPKEIENMRHSCNVKKM